METVAVVLEGPRRLALDRLELTPPGESDVVVDVEWSGISTGTERLLWTGRMPEFPGMGYPLVPGYEAVGRVRSAGARSGARVGERVFVPGARCFGPVRGLFGAAAARLVVPAARVVPLGERLDEHGVLLALAATALHAIGAAGGPPDLIVGHGVLGRLVARLVLLAGGEAPVVWERQPARREGARGYTVAEPEADARRDYRCICEVSGDPGILDALLGRLVRGGQIVLAGFYPERLSFDFPPAFMREAVLRVAAEWRESDLEAVTALLESGALSLDGLITHRHAAADAAAAYRTAFDDPTCLKMILDWRANA
jgi:3-hydroxyethyl bacteriochlorophyllide a dehydrogenase